MASNNTNRRNDNNTPWLGMGIIALVLILFCIAFYMGKQIGKDSILDMERTISDGVGKIDTVTEELEEINSKINNLEERMDEMNQKMDEMKEKVSVPPSETTPVTESSDTTDNNN